MRYLYPAHPDPQTPGPVSISRERRRPAPLPLVPGVGQCRRPLVSNKNRYRTTNAVSALLLDSNLAALLGENRALTVCAPVPSSTFQLA